MSLSHRVEALVNGGDYSAAYTALNSEVSLPEHLSATKTFLLSHLGDLRKAQIAAESLQRRHRETRTLAICKQVIARSLLVHGELFGEGLKLSAESVEIARTSLGLVTHARYKAEHVANLLHRVSIDEAAAQVPSLRRIVLASGDLLALVATHLVHAEIRFKHGQLGAARRDLDTVVDLLTRQRHTVLEGHRALAAAAIESLDGTAMDARRLATEALQCAERSGSVTLRIPALVTLAHILLLGGHYEGCSNTLDEAHDLVRPGGTAVIALQDTRLQLLLAQGHLREAGLKAQEIKALSDKIESGCSYYGLWYLHSRIRWLLAIDRPEEALATAEAALPHAERVADQNLLVRLQLVAAEALGACGRRMDGASLLANALRQNSAPPLDVVAEASRVSGCLSADDRESSALHFGRAIRILEILGHKSARDATDRLAAGTEAHYFDRPNAATQGAGAVARALETVAALTYVVRHPRLLGAEVVSLIESAQVCADSKLLKERLAGARASEGPSVSLPHSRASSPYGVRIPLGSSDCYRFELQVEACPSAAAHGTLRAVERLVGASIAYERHRQEQYEHQTSLWSADGADEQLGFVYASPAMSELVQITRRVAPTDVTVLITGETGTGKELFARALHRTSGRSLGTFVPFNCTTVPRDMLDSQLFGYRRGAFTGAVQEYPGLIRTAHGGTLFLDEIGEMPVDLQPKLLRFLESGEILPLGEAHPINVDVRVIAATNMDLDRLVSEGRFREDLYYRLHVVRLRLPPLRDRREEIPILVHAIAQRLAREVQREPLRLSEAALEYLTIYHWPGNTRQLVNELRRVMALTEPGAIIVPGHFSPEVSGARPARPVADGIQLELSVRTDEPLSAAVDRVERVMISRALERAEGNLEKAARALGISRKGLFLKRQRLGLS